MATNIGLKETAEILTLSTDEVMYHVQCGELRNSVDTDTMSWVFNLKDVLALKGNLDEKKQQEIAEQELLIEG